MKIVSFDVHPVFVRYDEVVTGHHVVFRMRTDDGLEGISFVSRLGGANLLPLAQMVKNAAEKVIGEDPSNADAFYRKVYGPGNGTTEGLEAKAASAIEVAGWDLRAKALGTPLWRLLGGARDRVPVSANWGVQDGPDRDTLAKRAEGLKGLGFRDVKFRVGHMTQAKAVEHMALVRELMGPSAKIILDASQQWTAKRAIAMGDALAEYEPYWIEDPVVAHDVQALREVREAISSPITAGETYHHIHQFHALMENRAVDNAMVDQDMGLSGFLRVAHLAEGYGAPVINHFSSEILGVGIAAVPNGLIVGFYPWAQPLFTPETQLKIEDGLMVLSHKPGLGLEIDEEALKRFAV